MAHQYLRYKKPNRLQPWIGMAVAIIAVLIVFTLLQDWLLQGGTAGKPVSPADNALALEYGESAEVVSNELPLYTFIRYPRTGSVVADAHIGQWVKKVQQDTLAELNILRAKDSSIAGELSVDYDSYNLGNQYAGVVERGSYYISQMAHGGGVLQTFNLDVKNGVLLANQDILDFTRIDDVLALLHSKIAELYPDLVISSELPPTLDPTWLEHIVLTHSGLDVVLKEAERLPSYLKTLTFSLSYAELGRALRINVPSLPTPNLPSATQGVTPDVPSAAPAPDAPTPGAPTPAASATAPAIRTDLDRNKPMVALSFDDGPSDRTPQLLDLLEKENVRATFCVVGNQVAKRSAVVARASQLGNEVIGHTWDHRQLTNLSPEEVKAQLTRTREAIKNACGLTSNLYRPSYGAVDKMVKGVSKEEDFSIINWSVDSLDWKSRNAKKVYKAITKHTKDRDIILCHDLYDSTIEAMQKVIPKLKKQGYQLVTISELMYYSDVKLEPGKLYFGGQTLGD